MSEKRNTGYVSARCDNPENIGFRPSVKNCSEAKCEDLTTEEYNGVKRKICGVNGRIPGNLGKCPKDVEKSMNLTVAPKENGKIQRRGNYCGKPFESTVGNLERLCVECRRD